MTTYTDAMIAELKSVPKFNQEIATVFAEKYKISPRSVISKVRALQLPYEAKTPAAKKASATKRRTKQDVIDAINEETCLELKSMSSMTLTDLEVLEEYFKRLAE